MTYTRKTHLLQFLKADHFLKGPRRLEHTVKKKKQQTKNPKKNQKNPKPQSKTKQ